VIPRLKIAGMTILLQRPEPNGPKPQRDVSGGKDTEVLMARIDDHCKRHPLDNLYKAAAALVDELRE
jgi:hypothetical protein